MDIYSSGAPKDAGALIVDDVGVAAGADARGWTGSINGTVPVLGISQVDTSTWQAAPNSYWVVEVQFAVRSQAGVFGSPVFFGFCDELGNPLGPGNANLTCESSGTNVRGFRGTFLVQMGASGKFKFRCINNLTATLTWSSGNLRMKRIS